MSIFDVPDCDREQLHVCLPGTSSICGATERECQWLRVSCCGGTGRASLCDRVAGRATGAGVAPGLGGDGAECGVAAIACASVGTADIGAHC